MQLNFKEWLLQENIRGEYWVMGNMAMGADGNVDDFNHEGYAIMQAQSEIVSDAADSNFVDSRKYGFMDEGVDWDEFLRDLIKGFVKENPEWQEAMDEGRSDEILHAAWQELGVDDELLEIAYGYGDVRNLAMKRWDWIAVRDNYVQMWNLTSENLRELSNAMDQMMAGEDDFEVELEIVSTGKTYDVPISVIETGNVQAVVNWQQQQYTQNRQDAYNKAMDTNYPPQFYKRWGD